MQESNPTLIKQIDKKTVNKICSGQVVLNLATAVKEILENSIDAGATSVNIRLKEYGSEIIEVSDNGSGVEPCNFQALTLKHHTSKITDFSDLSGVETFGFRGEALSSLCALANVTIITRHKDSLHGVKLVFDRDGFIIETSKTARQIGTTVFVENIFCTLPVRHKEFLRNVKKEFTKMCSVIYAYGLQSCGVSISCTNQSGNAKKLTVMETRGETVKSNIISVFGPKQTQDLLSITEQQPDQDVIEEYNYEPEPDSAAKYQLEGFISSCAHGCGRSTTDRQFFYINSRPTDNSKISKLVNEVYHEHNPHQYPFIVLNVKVSLQSIDINLTPDKRQILLHNEKLLLVTLKSSLRHIFKDVPSCVPVQNVESPAPALTAQNMENIPNNLMEKLKKFRTQSSDVYHNTQRGLSQSQAKVNQPKVSKFLRIVDKDSNVSQKNCEQVMENNTQVSKISTPASEPSCSNENMTLGEDDFILSTFPESEVPLNVTVDAPSTSFISNTNNIIDISDSAKNKVSDTNQSGHNENFNNGFQQGKSKSVNDVLQLGKNNFMKDNFFLRIHENDGFQLGKIENLNEESQSFKNEFENDLNNITTKEKPNIVQLTKKHQKLTVVFDDGTSIKRKYLEKTPLAIINKRLKTDEGLASKRNRKTITRNVTLDIVKKLLNDNKASETNLKIRFSAEIHPSNNEKAEDELRKELSKDMFSKMEILGQFNVGFIVTKLNSDLFIIDQHATDEKYNFETLQQSTVMQNQRLIIPQALELTLEKELLLLEHSDVIKKNGFDFLYDEDASATKRIKLTSIPFSKNWVFGKDDLDELLFMLEDAPLGKMCRPSRLRDMFASRACRKSVMIGTVLSIPQMRKLVDHMGEIEQPWNCPHGRPTIRHLVNIDMIQRVNIHDK